MSEQFQVYMGSTTGLDVWHVADGSWVQRETPVRGVVRVVAGCRDRQGTVFAGVVHDGVYRTTDAGARWEKVFDGDARSLAVDPRDQQVIYVGTEPVHLHRSEDGGETWSEVDALQRLPQEVRRKWWAPSEPHEGRVLKILVDDDDSRILYLCLEHGGVVRSLDYGQTWEDVSEGIPYLDIHSIARHPGRPGAYFISSARGFYRTDDAAAEGWRRTDQGMPWWDTPTQNYSHDFVVLSQTEGTDDVTLIVAGANGSPGHWKRPSRAEGVMLRSVDGAHGWHELTTGLPAKPTHMPWALAPHPLDPDRLLVGYSDEDHGPGELYATADRGDSWERVGGSFPSVRSMWLEVV